MNYDRYSKEDLIIMVNRQDYLLDKTHDCIEQLQAYMEMSYGEIDERINK
jgi:hypothetical protein